jgi:hypothetical protein
MVDGFSFLAISEFVFTVSANNSFIAASRKETEDRIEPVTYALC